MSTPTGPYRPGPGGPRQYPLSNKRRWPRRHPVWSAIIAFAALLIIIAAVSTPAAHPGRTTADRKTASTAARAPLTCHARASQTRPRDHGTVRIRIHTVPHAQVTAIRLRPERSWSAAGQSSKTGERRFRLRVGGAAPGVRLVVTVHVSKGGRSGSCRASMWPRPAVVAAAKAAPPSPAPAPAAQPTTTAPAPAPSPSCYPLSDEGTCYEPGEFCRDSDQGMSGIAGNGTPITCENNNGLRWEPS
jgi:hypothetical protein